MIYQSASYKFWKNGFIRQFNNINADLFEVRNRDLGNKRLKTYCFGMSVDLKSIVYFENIVGPN